MSLSSEAERGTPSLPLTIAAALGQCAALSAIAPLLYVESYTVLMSILTVVGAACSFLVCQRGLAPRSNAVSAGLQASVAIVLFLTLARRPGLIATNGGIDGTVVAGLSIAAVFGSFVWFSGETILFSAVWSIAMIGLSATINLNLNVLVAFLVFLFTVLFSLVHQNARGSAPAQARLSLRLLELQALTTALLWLATVLFGTLIAIPLQMVGRNLSLNAVLQKLKVPDAKKPSARRSVLTFENFNEFPVGLGPIGDDTTPLLRVESVRPFYWRARTFSQLSGRKWLPADGVRDQSPIDPARRTEDGSSVFTLPMGDAGNRNKTERVKTRFTPLGSVQAIYHAAEPREIVCAAEQINPRRDGTMGVQALGGPYEIESEVSIATPEDLNASTTNYPEWIRANYLAIPDRTLDELLPTATAGKTLPYDKAEAIRQFVAQRCNYTLEARPVPEGRNPADFFLNESREGYCDLYATSVALLCRAAGLPTRVTTGFNSGSPDPEHAGAYILKDQNRHAWCEVYFEGYGWIPFDATVSTQEANVAPTAAQPTKQKQRNRLTTGVIVLIALGALGLGYVAVSEFGRRGLTPTGGVARRPAERAVERAYQSALTLARRRGAERTLAMTTQEHLSVVRMTLGERAAESLAPLAEANDRLRFDATPLSDTEAASASAALAVFTAALKDKERG